MDEDVGRSAADGVARTSFERIVAEVCLGKVGAVAVREVSETGPTFREETKALPARPRACSASRRPSTRAPQLAAA